MTAISTGAVRRLAGTVALGTMTLVAASAPAGAADVGETIPAPVTTVSADGRSVTDGTRTLVISQAQNLDPAGQSVTLTGSGYDEWKGVYLTFCLLPAQDQTPTPCGGGIPKDAASKTSEWVSSNPPATAQGMTVPYGPGGSFEATIVVSPVINDKIDCRTARCGVVTRNDHTRSTDRSQDMFVPVTFAAASPSTTTTTVPSTTTTAGTGTPTAAPSSTTTTTTVGAQAAPAPSTTSTSTSASTSTSEPGTVTSTSVDAPDSTALAAAEGQEDQGGGPWPVVGALVALLSCIAIALGVRRRLAVRR